MMTTEQIKQALKDRNLMAVSRASGVAYETVRKVASGSSDDLKFRSVQRLSDYLEGRECQI